MSALTPEKISAHAEQERRLLWSLAEIERLHTAVSGMLLRGEVREPKNIAYALDTITRAAGSRAVIIEQLTYSGATQCH